MNIKRYDTIAIFLGGVKTERVFPGLSVLRKNKKMEVLYPEKKANIGPA